MRDLVGSKHWVATAGDERLIEYPCRLAVGDGKRWVERLKSRERRCPLVFVSGTAGSHEALLDTERLAWLLVGSAVVVTPDSRVVDEELQQLLPKEMRCWGGAVRVYQPGVRLEDKSDRRRHWSFYPEQIHEQGNEVVEEMLVRGVARRAGPIQLTTLATIEDVATKQREARLAELRATRASAKDTEWIQLLEEDNEALAEKLQATQQDLDQAETERDLMQADMEERVGSAEHEMKNWRGRALEAEKKAGQLAKVESLLGDMSELPESVPEVIDWMARGFPGRIIFTEGAQKAAKRASINSAGEIATVWRCLHAMATVLWEMHFGDGASGGNAGTLTKQFQDKTGFELTFTESGVTKADKKLMSLRLVEFDGEKIDITPHVKIGTKPPNILRVHYHAHQKKKLLVVGHCGDHLDTYGTRKL